MRTLALVSLCSFLPGCNALWGVDDHTFDGLGGGPAGADGGAGGSIGGSDGVAGAGGIENQMPLPTTGAGGSQPSTCGGVAATASNDCGDIDLNPDFAAAGYACADLGAVPGVPTKVGGVLVDRDDLHQLLVAGKANDADGRLYRVPVARDASCGFIGFAGDGVPFADAPYSDGGLAYGPHGEIVYARWPRIELGLIAPGSAVTDKVIDLEAAGMGNSPGALAFVAPWVTGAGELRLGSWSSSHLFAATTMDDAMGLFDVVALADQEELEGGLEGFAYVPPGSPLLPGGGLLVAEHGARKIVSYELGIAGEPLPETRVVILSDLDGATGAFLDPASGTLLFSTFYDGHVIALSGFAVQ